MEQLRWVRFKYKKFWEFCAFQENYSPKFSNERLDLFKQLQSVDESILSKSDSSISKVLSLMTIHLMMLKMLLF